MKNPANKTLERVWVRLAANRPMRENVVFHFRNDHNLWLAAGLILLTMILTFGLSIGQLGLYGNQWTSVLYPFNKSTGYIFQTGIQNFLISLFGPRPILYHLTNLILFTLDGILFFKMLVKLGIKLNQALASSLLFIIVPAFNQPAAAFELTPLLLGLAFSFVSVSCYLSGIFRARNGYTQFGIGVVFALLAFVSSPVVAVFEGLIIFVIFLVYCLSQKKINIPLGAAAAGHFVLSFLIFFMQSPSVTSPSFALFIRVLKNWTDSFILAWRQIIALPAGGGQIALYLLALGIGAGLLVFILNSLQDIKTEEKAEEKTEEKTEGKQLLINEILILAGAGLMGLLFFFFTGMFRIPIGTEYPIDLGMVVIASAAAVVVTSAVRFLFLDKYQSVILAILIVLSAGYRFQATREFVTESSKVENFLGQLQVKGDSFQSGTSLVVEQLPFDFTSTTAVESLIRGKFHIPQDPAAFHVILADNLEVRDFLRDPSQKTIRLRIEDSDWEISKDRLLSIWIPVGGCVEVIDPLMDLSKLPEGLSLAGMFSNPKLQIISNLSDVKQLYQFRTTINNDWCFYYQLANRQMQASQWDAVIQTYDETEKLQIHSERYQEYSPLLTAYIHENKLSEAMSLSKKLNMNPESQDFICKQWTQILSEKTIEKEVVRAAGEARTTIGCE